MRVSYLKCPPQVPQAQSSRWGKTLFILVWEAFREPLYEGGGYIRTHRISGLAVLEVSL